jgi:hypothetical protein
MIPSNHRRGHAVSDIRKLLSNPNRPAPGAAIEAAAWAAVQRHVGNGNAAAALESDPIVKLLTTDPGARDDAALRIRADVFPGSTADSNWSDGVLTDSLGSFMSSIASISAAARLMAMGAAVALPPASTLNLPSAVPPSEPSWIGELEPIPVMELAFDTMPMGPQKKLGLIVTMTRELAKRSDGRAIFGRLLRESAAAQLDKAIFSDLPGDATIHRGLLDGVSEATVPSSTDPVEILNALLQALAATGASGAAAIVVPPKLAPKITLAAPFLAQSYPVLVSRALDDDVIVVLDPTAFVHSIGAPEIDVSESAVLHMSDMPVEIVSTVPFVGDPVRSMFQTATIAMRLIVDLAYTQRGNWITFASGISW